MAKMLVQHKKLSVDHSSQVFHVSQIIICRPSRAAKLLQDFGSKPSEDIGMFGKHIYSERDTRSGLNTQRNISVEFRVKG